MADSLIGALRVTLGLDTAAFEGGLSKARKQLRTAGRDMQSIGDGLANIGGILSVGVTAPLAAFAATSMQAAKESKQAFGQVQAALTSMGGASGKTAEQLQAAAKTLQGMSTFDDDDILGKVTANLLTFGNVSGDVFDRAQLAAVNLSARLGQDLQSSAIQLGKALNDPLKGLTALSRVGVSFTAEQKAQIEGMVAAGDVAKAQGLILSELERQYGGAAQAMRDATPGADVIDSWREIQETVGDIALQVLPPLLNAVNGVLDAFNNLSPGMQKAAVAGAAVAAAIGPITGAIGLLVSGVGGAVAAMGTLGTVSLAALGPIGLAVAGVALAFAVFGDDIIPALKAFWATVQETIGPKLQPLFEAVGGLVSTLGDLFSSVFGGSSGNGQITAALILYGEIVTRVFGVAIDLITGAINTWTSLFKAFGALLRGDFSEMWSHLGKAVVAMATGIAKAFATMFPEMTAQLKALYEGAKQWLLDKLTVVFDQVRAKIKAVGDAFYELWDRVVGHSYVPDLIEGIDYNFRRLPEVMVEPAQEAADQVAQAFLDTAESVAASVEGMVNSIKRGDWGGAVSSVSGALSSISSLLGAGSKLGGTLGKIGSFLGPVGGIIGSVTSIFGGLFGGSSKKKAQKRAEEERKAAEAARAAEDAARKAAQLAADKRALEIQIMELSGDTVGALAARRADELAAADDSLDPLLERIYALEDEQAAAESAARAAEEQARAAQEAADAAMEAAEAARELAEAEAELAAQAAETAQTLTADLLAMLGGAGATWQEQAAAARRDRLAAERRAGEAATEAAEAAAAAWDETVKAVEEGRLGLIQAGNVLAALAAEFSITKLNEGAFTGRDGINIGALNFEVAKAQAENAKRLANLASANALQVQNVGRVLTQLRAYVGDSLDNPLGGGVNQGMLSRIAGIVGAGFSDTIRDAVQGLTGVLASESVRQRYQAAGPGLAGVRAALESLAFVRDGGRDVAAYRDALGQLQGELREGAITFGDYTRAVEAVDQLMGSAVAYLDPALAAIREAGAIAGYQQAGLDSIAYYFGQIGGAVRDLNAAAAEANEPIAQVAAAIGRLQSVATIFGESVQAATFMGANAGDANVVNASLIARAAQIAAGIIGTQQAAELAAATGLDKGITILLDGLSAFDPAAFENAFLRINDALARGAISAGQYETLFNTAIGIFNGTSEAFEDLRRAAKSLRDELVLSRFSTFTQPQKFEEANRQVQALFGRIFGGDTGAFSDLSGAVTTALEAAEIAFRDGRDFDRYFNSVLRQVDSLQSLQPADYDLQTATNTAALVAEVQGLRSEVRALQAPMEKTASNTGGSAISARQALRETSVG